MKFPAGFTWGVAAFSFQIESAAYGEVVGPMVGPGLQACRFSAGWRSAYVVNNLNML
jgi:hypothetical protein